MGDASGGSGAIIFRSRDYGKSFIHTELPFHPLMQIMYNPQNSEVLAAISVTVRAFKTLVLFPYRLKLVDINWKVTNSHLISLRVNKCKCVHLFQKVCISLSHSEVKKCHQHIGFPELIRVCVLCLFKWHDSILHILIVNICYSLPPQVYIFKNKKIEGYIHITFSFFMLFTWCIIS